MTRHDSCCEGSRATREVEQSTASSKNLSKNAGASKNLNLVLYTSENIGTTVPS